MSSETYKTVAEIAAKFRISPKTVYRNCSTAAENPWPCKRIGTGPNARIRFSAAHEAAIEELLDGPRPVSQAVDTAVLKAAGRRVLKARAQVLAA